jgi:hypothetical protein
MKTQQTHTPAPWDLEPIPYPEDGDDGWYLHRADQEPIFISSDEVSPEDARLIASAPELLSALQEILLHTEEDTELRFSVMLDKKALAIAKAAIAKATQP